LNKEVLDCSGIIGLAVAGGLEIAFDVGASVKRSKAHLASRRQCKNSDESKRGRADNVGQVSDSRPHDQKAVSKPSCRLDFSPTLTG